MTLNRKNHLALAEMLRLREADDSESNCSIIQGVLDGLREHLAMDVAFVSEFLAGERIFRFVSCGSAKAPIEVGGSDPLSESYCFNIVEGRLPELIQDAMEVPFAVAMPVTAALPVGAHLSVPLTLSDGRVFGTICCFSYGPDRRLNERNLDVLRIASRLTADVIERQAAKDARRKELNARISTMIEVGHFSMLYQPIVKISQNKVAGVEALVRFPDSDERSPSNWFDEADEVDLLAELEMAVIRRAISELQYLPRDIYLSLNVSLVTLRSSELRAAIEQLPKHRIVLELTEHEAIEDYDELNSCLEKLRDRAMFAVDDVGAGYSSMRHILDLGPDIIKLDVSMVRDVDKRPSRSAFIQAMVTYAKASETSIVAEGVECQSEHDELARHDVACAQGYHLCRPLPVLKVAQFISCDSIDGGPDTKIQEATDFASLRFIHGQDEMRSKVGGG